MNRYVEMLRPRTPTHWAGAIGAVLSLFSFFVMRLMRQGLPFTFAVLPALFVLELVVIVALVEHVGQGSTLKRKLLLGAGFTATFFAAFGLFAYWSFPSDRIKDFIIQEVERPVGPGGRRRPSGMELEIVDLSPSWLTGVDLTGVRFTQLPETPEDEPVSILIDEASARVSILSALGGGLGVSYDLVMGGGTIEGEYESTDTTDHIEAELEDVNLLTIGMLRAMVGLPLRGKLSGTIDITIAEEPAQTVGGFDLTITGLKIGDGRAKFAVAGLREGLTIEQIDAGRLHLAATIENGVAEIETFETDGPDIELSASGSIRLVRPVAMSRLDLLLRVKFSDAYRDKNDRTRGLFSLLDLTPQLRAARTADGALQYRVSGSPGTRIGTSPAGRAPGPGGGGRTARPGPRR